MKMYAIYYTVCTPVEKSFGSDHTEIKSNKRMWKILERMESVQ